MKRDNGLWVPDRDPGVLNRLPLVRGIPAYQLNRIDAAVKACRRGRHRAIDAGAHVGVWSLHLAHWFEAVEAFEPIPENYECLTLNLDGLDLQRRVRAWPNALSDRNQVLQLTKVERSSWSWSPRVNAGFAHLDHLTVAATSIDTFGWDDVDLIKVDVEGHEYAVLLGAVETIRRCRPVLIIEEKHDPRFVASEFLKSLGMRETWRKKHDRLFEWR